MKIPKNSPSLQVVVRREMAKGKCPYTKTRLNLKGKEKHWCGKLDEIRGKESFFIAQSYRPCDFFDFRRCELCWGE